MVGYGIGETTIYQQKSNGMKTRKRGPRTTISKTNVNRRVREIRKLLRLHHALTAKQINAILSHNHPNTQIAEATSLALSAMKSELIYGELSKQHRLRKTQTA